MLLLTRSEFENAASVLGIKPATLRQWRHRRAIPAEAKLRLVYFFGQPFQLVESSLETRPYTRPAGSTWLADLAGCGGDAPDPIADIVGNEPRPGRQQALRGGPALFRPHRQSLSAHPLVVQWAARRQRGRRPPYNHSVVSGSTTHVLRKGAAPELFR